jgi:hypothetical protein
MQSNIRPSRLLLGVGVALASLAALPLVAEGGGAPPCASFKSQAAAQSYFLDAGGSIDHGVGRLDDDHDGVACEALPGPFAGYATLGYNKKRDFFYGTASMPRHEFGDAAYACMLGNTHFPDAPRHLNVYRLGHGEQGEPLFDGFGLPVEAKPSSGRLIWRADRKRLAPGRYYAEFEPRVSSRPYGGSECPSFRSEIVKLP